ncbi:MAG: hypothetical protein KJ950_01120 [Proteobacteria bacterium]|nr:hypothetical protein [Pseudomonadota bacterium]MBU1686258.1 hypothetical protein [Pseudomonadota bacterium]
MKRLVLLLVLFVAALVFSIKIYGVWTGDRVEVKPAASQAAVASVGKSFFRRMPQPRGAYEPITGRNLFSPLRQEVIPPVEELASQAPVVAAPEIKEVKIAGREIVLFGTMSLGTGQSALISNPFKSEDDSRENRWVKIGDQLANLQVDDIQRDRLILREGNKRYVILLRDQTKPKIAKSGEPSATVSNRSQPTVVSTDVAPVNTSVGKASIGSGPAGKTDKQEGDEYVIVNTPFGPQRIRK